jgi:hypothetical protein
MAKAARKKAEPAPPEQSEWELRPWLLAGLLVLAGLAIHFASDDGLAESVPWRMALTALAFFAPLAAAFTLERNRYVEPAIFAGVVGLVMAGIAWRATSAGDRYSDEQFWFAAGVVSVGLALPLFQAGFHRRRFGVAYPEVHAEAWSDAICAAGALAFTGLSWLLLVILDQLFQLVGIELIDDLMSEGWFGWAYSGAAFGAGLGTLRNQAKILGTLQSVAMLVLSILAVPLALGLIVFLVALIATGGQALWNATDSATPVLLACAAGALALGNAILRDADAEMSGNRVLRYAALVLSLAILPLTVFAAISMGARIGQHGLSPERLWGLVAVAVAVAFGLAYLVAVVRGRKGGWREQVRRANLHLAAVVCVVALILALPILDFGAVSAKNQLARLEAGEVEPDTFDYAALRWDFGEAGRKALATLAKSGNARVAELANTALAQTERVYTAPGQPVRARSDFNLRVQPDDPELRELVLDYLARNAWYCDTACMAVEVGREGDGRRNIALISQSDQPILRVQLPEGRAQTWPDPAENDSDYRSGSSVDVREVPTRYLFVDGKQVGEPLD